MGYSNTIKPFSSVRGREGSQLGSHHMHLMLHWKERDSTVMAQLTTCCWIGEDSRWCFFVHPSAHLSSNLYQVYLGTLSVHWKTFYIIWISRLHFLHSYLCLVIEGGLSIYIHVNWMVTNCLKQRPLCQSTWDQSLTGFLTSGCLGFFIGNMGMRNTPYLLGRYAKYLAQCPLFSESQINVSECHYHRHHCSLIPMYEIKGRGRIIKTNFSLRHACPLQPPFHISASHPSSGL